MADKETEIFTIEKNKWTKISCRVCVLNGNVFIDFREMYQPRGENDFKPSKKGFTLKSAESVKELGNAIVNNIDKIQKSFDQYSGEN